MSNNHPNRSRFYAIEQHSIGITQHAFPSRATRDAFVAVTAGAVAITSATARQKARGVHVRYQSHD
ncbi:MAG: hypothetical protein NUV51_03680 [Sulfuricaulis sp.]|nr:hypothetical protein [Sulfuricaulis sp.]